MIDPQHRTLLAIADAQFRIGLALFSCAVILTIAGLLIDTSPRGDHALSGAPIASADPRPALARPSAAVLAYERGRALFKANCASCHKPDLRMTGPALKGAKERWASSGGDIYAWVRNSLGYLKSKPEDTYARALVKDYNGSVMTPNALTDDEIDAILNYVDNFYYSDRHLVVY